ncbi:MAG: biopolymer transporter ExbB [Gemmobacter sp.]|uniref:biopolymer transporter ExbB n=1 Tax=Gemmobacter sp. TaxID=1898957 RepID=UPI00391DD889
MLAVTGLVAAGAWLIFPAVEQVFLSNPWLNGFIGVVFLIGIFACFWQVVQLVVSVSWIEAFVARDPGLNFTTAPRLLAPLAALLRTRGAQMQISASSSRSILDSVATRIDEARDITRYLTNLLIFLGLLGTFYGLATTVPAVVETIRSLAPQDGETGVQVFDKLMKGLESQLGGMGTAFSSSLLGLAGSLVVGLLELFASHGQNRFYRELEEWLSSITRIGLAAGEGEAAGDSAALAGVLDRILTRLDEAEARQTEDRAVLAQGLDALAEGFRRLAERDSGGAALAQIAAVQTRIAEGQDRMIALIDRDAGLGADAEARMRLRSIDVQLLRILEEIAAGRQESIADLRADLGALTQAIRQLSRLSGR